MYGYKLLCNLLPNLSVLVPEPTNGPRDPIAVNRPYSSLARAGSLEDDRK